MVLLAAMAGIGGTFFLLERLIPRVRQPIRRPGLLADCLYVPLHFAGRVLVNFVLAGAVTEVARGVVASEPLDGRAVWFQALAVIVVLDFCFYVMHVGKHRWTWWWRLHETHHSSERLDFVASARFHPLEKLIDRSVFLVPLTLLSPGAGALLAWSIVDVSLGMLNHSNARVRLGPLNYFIVGPELHRWHHVRDRERQGCNFGNNLSIFDWLFGTAYLPAHEPDDFGIEEPDYPQDNVWRQFSYAFRPVAPAPTPSPVEAVA